MVASAAAGLPSPVGPCTDLGDDEASRTSSRTLRAQGFGARAAIHPGQPAVINECFAPSEDDVAGAERLLAEFAAAEERGASGVIVDGENVDDAIARRIRRSLA